MIKKYICAVVLLFLFSKTFANPDGKDSVIKNTKTRCSIYINTLVGVSTTYYDHEYNYHSGVIHHFPYEVRLYFLKNRFGFVYSSVDSKRSLPSYSSEKGYVYPFVNSKEKFFLEADRSFFIACNLSRSHRELKKLTLDVQCGLGYALQLGPKAFATAGLLYKLNSSIALNIVGTFQLGLTTSKLYRAGYINLVVRYRLDNKEAPPYDSINKKVSMFVEIGAHVTTAARLDYSFSNASLKNDYYPIPNDFLENDLKTFEGFYPSLSFGLKKKNHSVFIEGRFSKTELYETSAGGDYGTQISFANTTNYLAAGYMYSGKFKKSNEKKTNFLFFTGLKFLYQYKTNNYKHFQYSNAGGNHREATNKVGWNSSICKLLEESGFQYNCNKNVYLRLGVALNTIAFTKANYLWDMETYQTYSFDNLHDIGSKEYSKFLYSGENGNFKVIDNVFIKLGYSF